ncbi:MAG: prepilin-type N-terminal cleavage/methylation domain-containing protein [Candidatus Andersenbacteria bacterium]
MKQKSRIPISPIGEREGVRAGELHCILFCPHPRPSHKVSGLTFSPIGEKGAQDGFSLIESLIVISIIAIMSALAMQALPVARSNQQLVSDTEQIRAVLLDAKERALNQVRPAGCLPMADVASKDRSTCSDVGIAFSGNQVIEFAETNGTEGYQSRGSSKDFTIVAYDLTSTPVTGSLNTLVFNSAPPGVQVFVSPASILSSGKNPMAPSDTASIILNAGSLSRTITVHSYGTIDVK